MSSPEKALSERIRQLRRRHFGPRGKAEFARRLGLPLEQYERFERGTVPPGNVMLRMCELTGDDLQWLLTGVPARGTLVISRARGRHQELLARVARLLDESPQLAAPLEAVVDLLAQGEQVARQAARALPAAQPTELIPIFEPDELPDELPAPGEESGGGFWLASRPATSAPAGQQEVELLEPARPADQQSAPHRLAIVTAEAADGRARRFLRSRELAGCLPGAFGVSLTDATMAPMFKSGDAVLVAPGTPPRIGRPALCKFGGQRAACCRVWLGQDERAVHLGRVCDGQLEQMPAERLRWSLEVLYRLAPAA